MRTKEQQESERLNNIVTLQNKVIEGPEEHGLEWEETRDWNQVLREHEERIELEEQERNKVRKTKKKGRKMELVQVLQAVLRN